MPGGFIIERARERCSEEIRAAWGGVVFAIAVFPIACGVLMLGRYEKGTIAAVSAALIGLSVILCLWRRHRVLKTLDYILGLARGLGRNEYYRACDDLSAGEEVGELICGGKYLFSPLGLLCRWEEIEAADIVFHYAYTRSGYAYVRISVKVSLMQGGKMTVEITGREEIRIFSESADRFSDIIRQRCGVRAVKSFE